MPKSKKTYPFRNRIIVDYPYPSYKNPIRLHPNPWLIGRQLTELTREQLRELGQRIIANEKIFQRRGDKIPALPFWWDGMLPGVFYNSWCFECFDLIREALRHGVIKNRHDARFWGLKEKRALCGDCLKKRLGEMEPRKRALWTEYKKRGYWRIN